MMPPFLQSIPLSFRMKTESGTLQSSSAPLGFGGFQSLFQTHQPPDLSTSGLIVLFLTLSKVGMRKEGERKDGGRPGMGVES